MTEFHLTSFFCVPMKKKKKWLKVSPFAKHYDYLTEYLWGEQVSTVCPKGNVLEGSQHSSCQTVLLKYFISNYALLNATEDG